MLFTSRLQDILVNKHYKTASKDILSNLGTFT